MPMYEYESVEDGEVVTLLRSMAEADDPVDDPAGRGRTFRRRHSVFGVGVKTAADSPPPIAGGCCPCGQTADRCGRMN